MKTALRFSLLFFPVLAIAIGIVMWSRAADQVSLTDTTYLAEPIRSPAERAFEQRLEEVGASLPGEVGIAVVDVETGRLYEFNGDDILPQQSVSKLWVAMTALAAVDAGELDLAERISIRRADLTLFHQPIREIVRARGAYNTDFLDLMERAITRSDNAANDRLLRRVGGPEAVQQWLDEAGLAAIRFGTDERTKQSAIAGLEWRQTYSYRNAFYEARDLVPEDKRREAFEFYLAGPVDGSSANAIALALAMLARGELLSERSTQVLRDMLAETRSGPRRLKGGSEDGWRVEHKTGTGQYFDGEQSGYNDVGLLVSPQAREYAVAVMIGRTREPNPARMDMMQAVTRAVIAFDQAEFGEPEGDRMANAQ